MNSIFYSYVYIVHNSLSLFQDCKVIISQCILNFAFFYTLYFLAFKIHHKLLLWLQNLLVFISILLGCISIFLILHFNSLLNPTIISIILNSNPYEALEFIQFYFDTKTFVLLFIFLLGSFVILFYKKYIFINIKIATSLFICSILALLLYTYRGSLEGWFRRIETIHLVQIFYDTILNQSLMVTQYKNLNTILANTYDEFLSTRGGGNSF